jgi:hypothetical protein
MDKWFKDILPDKDSYHNRGRDQMRKNGGPKFECLWYVSAETIVKIQRGNLRFDSIFYNNAPVLKRIFACPRLKNDFPSFLSSLYVRTTNILSLWSFQWSNGHPSKFMFEMHFSISDNILTISLGSSFFFLVPI